MTARLVGSVGVGHAATEVADTTSHTLGSTGPVRFPLARWILAPRTTWQARRLAAEFGPGMDARTAWVMARLARHPEEHMYAMRHLNGGENAS